MKRTLEEAKSHFEDKLIEDIPNNPKRFYNYAKNFTRTSSTVDFLREDGRNYEDDKDKAELLNKFFTSVLVDEPADRVSCDEIQPPLSTLGEITTTEENLRDKMKKLKKHKSNRNDNISVNILSEVPNMAIQLAKLFSLSTELGQLPQDWRDANITPLHKKGSRTAKNNYRPVSLTSQVCKLLERIVLEHVQDHIEKNQIISCHQHGFQARCSCVTQLIECLEDWTSCLEEGETVDIIYLDFSKAFDSVPHKRLLLKLERLGIRGQAWNWISSFLHNRRQRVVLHNGSSSWSHVKSGVPQGSILGPVLFLLYINDMPHWCPSSTVKLFADDSKLYRTVRTRADSETLQSDLSSLGAWSNKWLLRFNADKCQVLRVAPKKKTVLQGYNYTLNGRTLEYSTEQKDLGVIISNDLSPSKHVDHITKKCYSKIGMIKRCFPHPSKDICPAGTRIRNSCMEPMDQERQTETREGAKTVYEASQSGGPV